MRASLVDLLHGARAQRCALVAFSVYTLDQAAGVIDAATGLGSAVILQVHPSGLGPLLWPLAAGLRALADAAPTPVLVHLDHASDPIILERAVQAGFDSIMADGSELGDDANATLVRWAVELGRPYNVAVEAELGRLAGSEDGLTVAARDARMTDPDHAAAFVAQTGAHSLAVCVGNVHGASKAPPQLDLHRLARISAACPIPLVLHGGSGLPADVLQRAIELGVAKLNVNTELRMAYLTAVRAEPSSDLVAALAAGRASAADVAVSVLSLAGSSRVGTVGHGRNEPTQDRRNT